MLRTFVKLELFEGQSSPPSNSGRFFPEERDIILNHMYNTTSKGNNRNYLKTKIRI